MLNNITNKLDSDKHLLLAPVLFMISGIIHYSTGSGLATGLVLGFGVCVYGLPAVVSGFIAEALISLAFSVWIGIAFTWWIGLASFIVLPWLAVLAQSMMICSMSSVNKFKRNYITKY